MKCSSQRRHSNVKGIYAKHLEARCKAISITSLTSNVLRTVSLCQWRCAVQELKAANVRYVVAPYEADAQMAHLALTGQVQGVITEDSDLLVYGCQKVNI